MSFEQNSNRKIYRSREINNLLPEGFAMCFVYNPQQTVDNILTSKIAKSWKYHFYHCGKHICIEEHAFFKVDSIPAMVKVIEELNYNFRGKYLYAQKSRNTVCKIIRRGKILAEHKSLEEALNAYIPIPRFYIPDKDSINLYKLSTINELAKEVETTLARQNSK